MSPSDLYDLCAELGIDAQDADIHVMIAAVRRIRMALDYRHHLSDALGAPAHTPWHVLIDAANHARLDQLFASGALTVPDPHPDWVWPPATHR